jgi:hypothetical protein
MDKMTDRFQDRISWIRELVKAEEQLEESGIVDMGAAADPERLLLQETLLILQQLKNDFIEAATAFNELKSTPLGRIKIYGIAKTHSDFMLFRNGFKMIFSLRAPGQLSIRFNFIGSHFIPTQAPSVANTAQTVNEENILQAKLGPFGELSWTFQDEPVRMNAVVKYYLTTFIKESAK